MKRRTAILISGGGSNMQALVRDMLVDPDHPAQPVLVVSDVAGAGGLARAATLGVPAEVVARRDHADRAAFEQALTARLDRAAVEIICLAGFMRVLSAQFVDRWAGRILNIHPSLLPLYKGLDTHARALAAGDTEAGCSVHVVTPELDDGPVLGQARIPVLADDTAATLADRVLVEEHRLYPETLRRFAVSMPAAPEAPGGPLGDAVGGAKASGIGNPAPGRG